jgi:hypothetical protein
VNRVTANLICFGPVKNAMRQDSHTPLRSATVVLGSDRVPQLNCREAIASKRTRVKSYQRPPSCSGSS